MTDRYVAERGSGCHGTAYNTKDYEVLDTHRKAGARVMCRASQSDASMIAQSLNERAVNEVHH